MLILGAAIGLALVYSREPVYRASASVLTVEPKAVDTRSSEADIEHVTIQGRLLLGEELLGRLSRQLEGSGDALIAGIDTLRNMLSVDGHLYLGMANPLDGLEIFRSKDGAL